MIPNLDLDTEQGMAKAVRWTNTVLGMLHVGGQWLIPRSGAVVTVLDRATKQVLVHNGDKDPAIARVLLKAGWTVNYKKT